MGRFGSSTAFRGAWVWVIVAVMLAAGRSSGAPIKCVPSGFGESTDCCAGLATPPHPVCSISTASPVDPTVHPNILVIVSDDQSYCQYGFMGGVCKTSGGALSSPWQDCRTDVDCPLTAPHCSGHLDPQRLRLNDWSCRYRQAPTVTASCVTPDDAPYVTADDGDDKFAWPFRASRHPCGSTPSLSQPIPVTPHLDRLAAQGYVFTRAHVSGNQCKSSRSSMSFGRHHRHNQWFAKKQDQEACDSSGHCDTTRHDPLAARLNEADSGDQGAADYKTVIYGKAEVFNVTGGGYEAGTVGSGPKAGKFDCPPTGSCPSELESALQFPPSPGKFPKIPAIARTAKHNVADVVDLVRNDAGVFDGGKQKRPFFFWFAPKMPHAGGPYGTALKNLYPGFVEAEQQHMGRISRLDLAVGTLLDELEGTCVCTNKGGGAYEYESVLDHTVVVFLTDHGVRMYNAKRQWTENNHRTPLIINHPSTRGTPVDGSRVVRDDLAHSIDLLPTVLTLAGTGSKPGDLDASLGSDAYDYGRDLWTWLQDGMQAPLRRAVYGEEAKPKGHYGEDRRANRQVYVIPRAGEIGVCLEGDDATVSYEGRAHRRPCWPDDADACGSGDACGIRGCSGDPAIECADDDGCGGEPCRLRGRCVNDPTRACLVGDGNAQCVTTDLCALVSGVGWRCKFDSVTERSLADRARPKASGAHAGTAICSSSPTEENVAADCVPPGVELCQALVLKVVAAGNKGADGDEDPTEIVAAYDLNWDPDQEKDLTAKGTIPYLGRPPGSSANLESKLLACLVQFWHDETSDGVEHWRRPTDWDNCPFEEPIAATSP